MTFKFAAALAAIAFAVPAAAQVAPTITVTPTLAPNAFGSPSYTSWVANSIYAQENNLLAYGQSNSPTRYQAQAVVGAAQAIVTGFPSWMGMADPGTVYGAQYANELGNRMLFGIKINGNGGQFSLSQLSFNAMSSDAGNELGFGFAAGSYNYSNQYVGFLKGADGILFTGDDVLVISGANTQLVDGLIGRGSGASDAAYCDGCTIAQQQQAINDAAGYFTMPTLYTGTYSLGGSQGLGVFTILPQGAAAVPEPATWAMIIAGFGLAGAAMRRRRVAVALA